MALLPGSEITVGGVVARVAIDGFSKGIERGKGPWREVVYRVAWDDSDAFMDALMGLSTSVGGRLIWPVPHSYPGNLALTCQGVRGEPKGAARPDPDKLVAAEYCYVTARYESSQYDVFGTDTDLSHGGQSVPWARDTQRSYIQPYPIPKANLVYVTSGEPVANAPHARVPHKELRRSLIGVSFEAAALLDQIVGKVNAAPLWGYNTGTLLCEPYEVGVENLPDGSRTGSMDITLVWRAYDWNMEPTEDGFAWDFVKDGSDRLQYEYADFSVIQALGS